MALTFTRAQAVAIGEPVTSSQLANLCTAFNERIKSGFGDPAWRIADWWLSFLRAMTVGGNDGDFLEKVQMAGAGNWPSEIIGLDGGVDPSNPLIQFITGNPSFGTRSEQAVINAVPRGGITGAADAWELAKNQRGLFDPGASGAISGPMFTAARNFAFIAMKKTSVSGTSFGGYQAGPAFLSPACCDTGGASYAYPNLEIKFKSLKPDELDDIVYPGTCAFQDVGSGCDETTGHVYGVFPTPWAYYVLMWDLTVEVLLRTDYIEGPYEDDIRYTRDVGDHLGFALHAWAREFRGSDEQRAVEGSWLENAFDFQVFLGTQYMLAPAKGKLVGGVLHQDEAYPQFVTFDTMAAGSSLTVSGFGGTAYNLSVFGGTVIAGALLTCSGVTGGRLQVVDDTGRILCEITDFSAAETVLRFATFSGIKSVSVNVVESLTLSAGGSVIIEMAELMEYQPSIHDAYAVLRVAGLPLPPDEFEEIFGREDVDNIGTVETEARTISESYQSYGAAVSLRESDGLDPVLTSVNKNGVFDAVRRVSQMVRIVNRFNLTGYAVENGKSVLWFSRDSSAPGLATGDMFEGIGPSTAAIESGQIKEGRTYIASGPITYGPLSIAANTAFTGTRETQFSADAGVTVKEYDGIRATAEAGGFSNEWVMGLSLKQYHSSLTSTWNKTIHADRFPLMNRCLAGARDMNATQDRAARVTLDRRFEEFPGLGTYEVLGAPEAPSGYSYMRTESGSFASTNPCAGDPACEAENLKHYQSCQVYQPPYEIESAVADGAELKVTFKTRFQSCPLAPASIARDVATWTRADVVDNTLEPYRTDENGIREYLLHVSLGTNCHPDPSAPDEQRGNEARDSGFQLLPDNPWGACYPSFHFVKLMPLPYDDGNDLQDPQDTPFTHDVMTQGAVYLRAMCEGFIDDRTTIERACAASQTQKGWFDFKWESFCNQAGGGYSMHPLDFTDFPNQQMGWGPLPNTLASANVFNAFVTGINLLTRARVMLPMEAQIRYSTGGDRHQCITGKGFDSFDGGLTNIACSATPITGGHLEATASPDASTGWGSWGGGAISASKAAYINSVDHLGVIEPDCCAGGEFNVAVTTTDFQLRWNFTEADSVNALPALWRDYLTTGGAFILSKVTTVVTWTLEEVAAVDSEMTCGGTNSGFYDMVTAKYYNANSHTTTTEECAIFDGDGTATVTAPALPNSVMTIYACSGGVVETHGPSTQVDCSILELDVPAVKIPFTS